MNFKTRSSQNQTQEDEIKYGATKIIPLAPHFESNKIITSLTPRH